MKLEEITLGISLEGIEPTAIVQAVAAVPIRAGSVQLIYWLPDGSIKERLLSRRDEETIRPAVVARPWSFDGDGEALRITSPMKADGR